MRRSKRKKTHRVLWLLLLRLMQPEQLRAVHIARIKAATYYVKAVQTARSGLMGYLGLCLLRYVMGFGFLLLHAGLALYLPWTLQEKGLLFLILGGSYMLITGIAFMILLAQRTWMKVSSADEAVIRAVQNRSMFTHHDDDLER